MGSGASSVKSSKTSINGDGTKELQLEDVRDAGDAAVRPSSSSKRLGNRKSSASKIRPSAEASSPSKVKKQPSKSNVEEIKQREVADAEQKVKELEAKLTEREQQMAKLEGENLDLQDNVGSLEGQLQYYRNASAVTDNQECEETLHIKDQTIAKLEEETQTVQEQIRKLRIKYKKKLRAVNAQVAEAKQSLSNKILEMNDEISRLKEENDNLEEKIREASSGVSRTSDAVAAAFDVEEDSRTSIILDLSNKVSEQDSKIIKLEQMLAEKEREVESLKSAGAENPKATFTSGPSYKSQLSNDIGSEASELSELKQIAEEMKKLKKKKKSRKIKSNFEAPDFRELSSTSRDSGVYEKDSVAKQQNSAPSRVLNDDWDTDSGDDVTPVTGYQRLGSGVSRTSFTSDLGDTDSDGARAYAPAGLDPSSIRRISAPRRRGKATPDPVIPRDAPLPQLGGLGSKPPSGKKQNLSSTLDKDMDNLLNSIDNEVLCFTGNHSNTSHRGNLTTVSG